MDWKVSYANLLTKENTYFIINDGKNVTALINAKRFDSNGTQTNDIH